MVLEARPAAELTSTTWKGVTMPREFDLDQAKQAEGLGNVMQDYLAENVPESERCKMALSVAMTYAFMNRWRLSRVLELARGTYSICQSLLTK